MKNPELENEVLKLKNLISEVNFSMSTLHENSVEVRITYKDAEKGQPPKLDLWRLIEHVDYLK